MLRDFFSADFMLALRCLVASPSTDIIIFLITPSSAIYIERGLFTTREQLPYKDARRKPLAHVVNETDCFRE